MLGRVSLFMAWRRALGFTLATEIFTPDAVYCVGVTASERQCCLARIAREPQPWTKANFGPVEWLPAASIDPAIVALLPVRPWPMTPKEISGLEPWFGAAGRFPAVRIATGELGI